MPKPKKHNSRKTYPPSFPGALRVCRILVTPGEPLKREGDHFDGWELQAIVDFLTDEIEEAAGASQKEE